MIAGEWDVAIKTPIGSLQVLYTFTDDAGASQARQRARARRSRCAISPLQRQRVTWRQSVTKPMRLNLEFDVVVDGDRLAGHSKAGRLPALGGDVCRR